MQGLCGEGHIPRFDQGDVLSTLDNKIFRKPYYAYTIILVESARGEEYTCKVVVRYR